MRTGGTPIYWLILKNQEEHWYVIFMNVEYKPSVDEKKTDCLFTHTWPIYFQERRWKIKKQINIE